MLHSSKGKVTVLLTVLCAILLTAIPTLSTNEGALEQEIIEESKKITISFAGDVHGEGQIKYFIQKGGDPFAPLREYLTNSDISVINLESAISQRGMAREKQYTFNSPSVLLDRAAASGIDIISIANNHTYDYGQSAFLDTIDAIESKNIIAIGGGINYKTAYKPYIIEKNSIRVAFLAFANVNGGANTLAGESKAGTTNGWDSKSTNAAIREAKKISDIVVVLTHWGSERALCPRNSEINFADQWIASGANAIIGTHPHVLQPITVRSDALVAFSLGNFIFYAHGEETTATGVLTVTFEKNGYKDFSFKPARINTKNGTPLPVKGEEAMNILDKVDSNKRNCNL